MYLFGTIFINKENKCHVFKVRELNDTFCINKITNETLRPIYKYISL